MTLRGKFSSAPDVFRRAAQRSCRRFDGFRSEAGSSLVEVAITTLMLFTLVVGIIECSRAAYIDHFLAHAAREATRYAMVRGASWPTHCASVTDFSCSATDANVSAFVRSIATGAVRSSDLTVTTTWPGVDVNGVACSSTISNAVGCMVVVKLTYSFVYASPLLPRDTLTLTSSSAATISQ